MLVLIIIRIALGRFSKNSLVISSTWTRDHRDSIDGLCGSGSGSGPLLQRVVVQIGRGFEQTSDRLRDDAKADHHHRESERGVAPNHQRACKARKAVQRIRSDSPHFTLEESGEFSLRSYFLPKIIAEL